MFFLVERGRFLGPVDAREAGFGPCVVATAYTAASTRPFNNFLNHEGTEL